ncbi:fatty acid oxidation complex subunit alpha FadB [Pseudidiomarina terrestris]|uniref:fatty acid oxidation complex subunit alpha FadB n=1 Tax=Pseudidiomarina terrestris TaxID=2820060 RepID=UPI002656E82D|nr:MULTISPECIES: fatty acid oxidation complex subunit alpha FadB [unclassified Pseudidiomarina]MDN7128001.1 fatty acid oxidation complex subunit alpha FadB [Pseudidiomarina sp. 1APR75-33.1]MDN7135660.1 fatty acid oxidation complex subunit alpha FadB [Pseudidiomarina sp. 1ASP75-5]MEA3588595.1 fatty acid oxidation complex subunit alpha FadB [Pseudidiomarina sp. 1APP75-27a]
MIYQGDSIRVEFVSDGIAELQFAAAGSVNKFDQKTLEEFSQALAKLAETKDLSGVIVTSSKPTFIVGADITEFQTLFADVEHTKQWVHKASRVFDQLEDLPVPTVAAVTGFALGGGCEATLACDYRVADTTATIGLPEVKLGLIPGFGGTMRLPRIIGPDNALEWITTGKNNSAVDAQKVGLVDAVVAPEKLRDAALDMVQQAIDGDLDWRAKRQPKLDPLQANDTELTMTMVTAKGMVAAKAGKHYPAPHAAIKAIEDGARSHREEALNAENEAFVGLTQTDACHAQVGIFMADQFVKGKAKKAAKQASKEIKTAAVLGAGIMGGGIAYQSAYKGVPVVMKDIRQEALDQGMGEASKILGKMVERGKIDHKKMAKVLSSITPTLLDDAVKNVDIVVEAVVENPDVKGKVLAQMEDVVADDAIIVSNTSTISIDRLAKNLKDPSRFCGMHFFNPVHKMPLVEVIRGEKTSDETVAAVVAYASRMGKTAIVVNDCPGFLVNRVLFPYLAGFAGMVDEGADFAAIDKVMERQFGWPMGPAYLSDVVGIDTADHCTEVMADGFPSRMPRDTNSAIARLAAAERYGQKNGKGFYNYGVDKKGRPSKEKAPEVYEMLGITGKEFSADEIIHRTMVPMVNECVRCLEEGIVSSAAECDISLLYGLGFPPFRGGPFRYLETLGLAKFVEIADKYAHLGEMYQVTDGLREMAKANKSYFAG